MRTKKSQDDIARVGPISDAIRAFGEERRGKHSYRTLEARILAVAREDILMEREGYICIAVRTACGVVFTDELNLSEEMRRIDVNERAAAGMRINARISQLLSPYVSLNKWIEDRLGISTGLTTAAGAMVRQDAKMRKTRILWIDDMIEWWENHGESWQES